MGAQRMGLVSILTALATSLGLPLGLLIAHLTRDELENGNTWFHVAFNLSVGLAVTLAFAFLGAPLVLAGMIAFLVLIAFWLVHEIPDYWKTFGLCVLVMTAAPTIYFLPLASITFISLILLGTVFFTDKQWIRRTTLSYGVFVGTAVVLGLIL